MKKAKEVVDEILGKETPKEESKIEDKETKSKSDEAIEEMKEQRCGFPGCNGKQLMTISLPVIEIDENGNMKQEGDENSHISIPIPFCARHVPAMMSNTFALQRIEGGFTFVGPVETVMVVEAMLMGFKAELLKELKKE